MRYGSLVALLCGFTILLTACSSEPERPDTGAEVVTPGAPSTGYERPPSGTGASTAGLANRPFTIADLNDPSSPVYQRTIYFEYDSAEILPEFLDVLRAHALLLGTNPEVSILLEGHTDERGTREYNLALGDQRTETVRLFLMAEGVAAGQLSTLSYGEERPASLGRSEADWALNRRVQLVY